MSQQMSFQLSSPTPAVKKLIIINLAIWVVLLVILENLILREPYITMYFGLIPQTMIENFFVWQPVTYMFLHSLNPMHVLFNMMTLWFFGTELENRWGQRLFLIYYFFTGIGAAFFYLFGVALVGMMKGMAPIVYTQPVVGASGAVFGILLAYGLLFGDRTIYFFGAFPMQAKYFVAIIGTIEVISLLTQGLTGAIANLAHIGGLVSGIIFLFVYTKLQQTKWKKGGGVRSKLKLVVNRDEPKEPKFWN
jgi:membrane associated rhomboid family serine protease